MKEPRMKKKWMLDRISRNDCIRNNIKDQQHQQAQVPMGIFLSSHDSDPMPKPYTYPVIGQ